MLANTHDVSPQGPVVSHRCAGVVHVVEVGGGVGDVLDAIHTELDECGAHALVVDLTRGVTITGTDVDRIAWDLENRGFDRLHIRVDDGVDGQSIAISLV